jgi:hypothetical protein
VGQTSPIHANDAPTTAQSLAWAQAVGLVDVRAGGSWSLTPLGVAGMLELLGKAHPFETRAEHSSRQARN